MMEPQEAADRLGILWAQAASGKEKLHNGPSGIVGISPAMIALLVQVAAVLIPKLMDQCDLDADLMRRMAKVATIKQRLEIGRQLRAEMGTWNWWWNGGHKLTNAAVRVAAMDSCQPMIRAFE